MKKIILILSMIILIACNEQVINHQCEGLYLNPNELGIEQITFANRSTGNQILFVLKDILFGKNDTIIVINGEEILCEINYDGSFSLDACNEFSAAGLAWVSGLGVISATSKIATTAKELQSIKLIATENIAKIGNVKNTKWLELSYDKFASLQKIFKSTKVNNGWYKMHGLERAVERNIPIQSIINCMNKPTTITKGMYGRKIHTLDDLIVIVEKGKCVTAYFKGIF